MVLRPWSWALLAIIWLAVAHAAPGMAQQPLPAGPAPAQQPTQAQPAAPPQPAAPAPAASTFALPAELLDPVERLSKSIESAEKSIQQLKELEGDLQRLRTNVEQIIYDSTASAELLRPQLAEVKSQIEKLGAPPAKDQPPESPTIAAERARLNALAGGLDGAVKTAELAWVRAKQLIDRITVMRYQNFTRNLLERRTSPLLPSLWRDVFERFDVVWNRAKYYGGDWLSWAGRRGWSMVGLLAAVAITGAGLWHLARRFIYRRRQALAGGAIPDFFDRVAAAAWQAPLRMLAPAAAAVLLYAGLDQLELLFSPWERTAETLLKGGLVYIAGSQIARAVLAPRQPQWRIIPVTDATAMRLLWFVRGFLAMYIIDTVLVEFGRAIYAPLVFTVAQAFLTNVAFALLLVTMLLTVWQPQAGPLRAVNGRHEGDPPLGRHEPYWIKLPLWVIAALILVASAFGFVALGRFVAQQVVLTGTVLALVGLMYLAIRAVTRGRDGATSSRVGSVLEGRFGLDQMRQGQLAKLGEVAATFSLLLLALPVLLLQWGFAAADIRDWAKALFFGFEIGQFRISLVRILIGIVIFTALLFLTRLIQRWLRDKVLAQSRMDTGVANSVETAVGYGGIALAALISVSYAGFDITSLAIVAGALSVGIGFGLQSIVNNFVSGLILLVERPIKVGDWIVVGDQQGNVRRISVRSTEIETFDRASLIVPNSELISGRVLNWTHRNMLGRVVIKVAVDPASDPQKMLDILLAAAREQPVVLQSPEPLATLDYFGTDKLEFSLRATLTDVNKGARVQSDLRLAILKGCRKAGLIATMTTPQPPIEQLTAKEVAVIDAQAKPAAPLPQPAPVLAATGSNGQQTIPPPPPITIPR